MIPSRKKTVVHNVAPAILANACVFLFLVVDGIFAGQGAGSRALGTDDLALPFVLLAHTAVGILMTLLGSALTDPVCSLLGASEEYLPLVREYIFW